MNTTAKGAAAAYIAPKVLRGFRWQWLLYGAAAYYGLRYMSKHGIFPKQTGAALNLIDKGIDIAKQQIGFADHQGGTATPSPQSQQAELPH